MNAKKIAIFVAAGLVVSAAHASPHAHHARGERKSQHAHGPNSGRSVSIVSVIRRGKHHPRLLPVEAQSLAPIIVPGRYPGRYSGRGLLILPAALKGSRQILLHQNEMADQEDLDRIQDDEDLTHMRATRLLVALPSLRGIQVDDRLPANRRYCRPWTARFLVALATAHYARFRSSLQVNSAVRTVEFQQHLLRVNGNAAPAAGETASPHLTGQAIDLAKRKLSSAEIAWLRGYLLPLVEEGKLDVEEEFQQSCFHISVYRSYSVQLPGRHHIMEAHHPAPIFLAKR